MSLPPLFSADPAHPYLSLRRPHLARAVAPAAMALMLAALAPAAMAHPPGGPADPGGPGHDRKAAMGMHRAPAIITVTGSGQATTAPDIAQITVGVTVQAPTAGEAMSQNATRQQAVIDALKARGIEARDIQTSGLNLSPVQNYPQDGKPPVITGYSAGNMVTIRVRDLPQLGPVLDALVTAGANEIQGISFQRDDAKAVEAEARKNAVGNARERAEVIAAAAGQRLGQLISLQDGGGDAPPPRPVMQAMMARSDAGGAPPVEAGELSMSAQVVATWQMLPLEGEEQGDDGPADGPDGQHGPDHGAGHPPPPPGGPAPRPDGAVPGAGSESPLPRVDAAPAPSGQPAEGQPGATGTAPAAPAQPPATN